MKVKEEKNVEAEIRRKELELKLMEQEIKNLDKLCQQDQQENKMAYLNTIHEGEEHETMDFSEIKDNQIDREDNLSDEDDDFENSKTSLKNEKSKKSSKTKQNKKGKKVVKKNSKTESKTDIDQIPLDVTVDPIIVEKKI